jgi:hypothetical protein
MVAAMVRGGAGALACALAGEGATGWGAVAGAGVIVALMLVGAEAGACFEVI